MGVRDDVGRRRDPVAPPRVQGRASPPMGPVLLSWPMDVLAREVVRRHRPASGGRPGAAGARSATAIERIAELLARRRESVLRRRRRRRTHAGPRTRSRRSPKPSAPRSSLHRWRCSRTSRTRIRLSAGGVAAVPERCARVPLDFDVIVVIGARAFFLYYYQPNDPVPPEAKLVHAHPDPWEVAKNYPTEVGVVAYGRPLHRRAHRRRRRLADGRRCEERRSAARA